MIKRNILLELEYDGTRYDGWAGRAGKESSVSIEGKLSAVISKMNDEETEVIGAVRTDAGVHAYRQVACFKTSVGSSLTEIERYINRYLPQDIAVTDIREVPERFHPVFNLESIEYEYKITFGEVPSVFDRRYNYYCFKRPDMAKMKEACQLFHGKHDLRAFSDNKRQKKSTVRVIRDCSVYAKGEEASIRVKADDFWPGMARIIVGTIVAVGKGEKTVEDVKRAIETGEREYAGEAIDSRGLFLAEVTFKEGNDR